MKKKSNLLREQLNGTYDFKHCRSASVSQLYRAGLEYSPSCHNIPASNDVLRNFSHLISIDVLHE